MAKLLSKILTPIRDKLKLTPNEDKLKNTFAAKEALKDITVPDSHILVSFDVKQLFTSIP